MSKKPRRVRMVDCPYCGNTTPVDRAQKLDGEWFKITTCQKCFHVINNNEHPGKLVEEGA